MTAGFGAHIVYAVSLHFKCAPHRNMLSPFSLTHMGQYVLAPQVVDADFEDADSGRANAATTFCVVPVSLVRARQGGGGRRVSSAKAPGAHEPPSQQYHPGCFALCAGCAPAVNGSPRGPVRHPSASQRPQPYR